MRVAEWENQNGYGSHRVCRTCNDAIVEVMTYGCRIKCRVKHAATGHGSVKPLYSCINWNPAIPGLRDMELKGFHEILGSSGADN